MIRTNQFQFFELGQVLQPIRSVAEGHTLDAVFADVWRAHFQLKSLLEKSDLSLTVSRPAAQRLLTATGNVWKRMMGSLNQETPADGENTSVEPVSWAEANAIQNALRDFEAVLAAELQEMPTYHVSKKAIFSTADLIERADAIFDADVGMTEEARADVRQAGRCLAFELWTATGFHVFRATETMILGYYEALTKGSKPLKESQRNWGNYIKLIQEEGGDQKLVDYLTYFKNNHRNPVIHPNISLDKNEAIAIFHALPNAIVPLAKAIAVSLAAG
jgi:hypothetical protein